MFIKTQYFYLEHGEEDLFQEIAGRYLPDAVLENEYGERSLAIDRIEDQRLVSEEYIAYLAQKNTPKPSWWKEFIQKIRMFLSRLPGFENVRMTTDQIETVLARSARNMRKNWYNRRSSVILDPASQGYAVASGTGEGLRFKVEGRYFKNWQEVIAQFKKDLEGIELNGEQQDIYDVVLQQKDKIRLRINDLNELEDVFVNFGTRKKGIKKLISVHYAGLRNPVTALEVLNIGDVIRRGTLAEEGTAEHPESRRYELKTGDGTTLKVIIDFNRKNDKNKSVINFYSDRKPDTGAHNVSSGIITDLKDNILQDNENASGVSGDLRFSIIGEEGAARLDRELKQNNLDNLHTAKAMLEAGKDAKTIKLATSWEKGGDGKWRMEVPDIEFTGTEVLSRDLNNVTGFLDDLLDAPELFSAYPQLKNLMIRTVMEHEDTLPENVGGRYDGERNIILINAKATALTQYEKEILRTAREEIEESWNLSEKEITMRKELEMELDPEKIRKAAYTRIEKLEKEQLAKFRNILVHEIQHAIQHIEGFAKGGSVHNSNYINLAGEVEARNAQKRKNMTSEEKRQSLLAETEDVAEESKIYIFGNGGRSELALFDNRKKMCKIISALQKIVNGSEEETVPGLRNDLAQYGGTNDITFCWGNKKKGIYHIAYRRGIDTLLQVIDAVAEGKILRFVEGNKTVILEKDGFEAVLALSEYGKQKSWLLSGWKTNTPDASGEVGTQSTATQPEPTFSRQELGAGINNISHKLENASGETDNYGRLQTITDLTDPASQGYAVASGVSGGVSFAVDREETPAFKKWFDGSKVVDENGKPLVVYHGTNADFYSFDTENGAWFSKSPEYAESMAEERSGNRIIQCYLSIKNPMTVKIPPQQFAADTALEKSLIKEAKEKGHDGLIIENDTENELEKDVFYVVFEPTQIKSATDNAGTFDPENPDIRFALMDYSEEQIQDHVNILKPFVGVNIDMKEEKYRNYLKEKGVDIPDEDADLFFRMAVKENRAEILKASLKKNKQDAWNYWRSTNPLIDYLLDFTGDDDFYIVPTEQKGEAFTGSFIAPEYVKWSEKRKKKDTSPVWRNILFCGKNLCVISLQQRSFRYGRIFPPLPQSQWKDVYFQVYILPHLYFSQYIRKNTRSH